MNLLRARAVGAGETPASYDNQTLQRVFSAVAKSLKVTRLHPI
jgi:hypothetical protein